MTDLLVILVKCLGAILVGIFAGNGAVYFFNKIPPQWLCDYGETPSEELKDPYTQRIKSYPWKFTFTMAFIIIGIKLVMEDWQFAVAAICVMWLLLEMAIADLKYRIVPDQFIILLAVSALGFLPFHGGWQECLIGGIIGFAVMGFVAILGKAMYHRESLGGGDIKLFASLGLVNGINGILIIFALSALMSAGHLVYMMLRKKIKRGDTIPMVPYIGLGTTIYLVFLWGRLSLII